MHAARLSNSAAAGLRLLIRPSLYRAYAVPAEFKQPPVDPQLGDYPQLPPISRQYRSAKGWWDAQGRRNFEEPVHEQDEALTVFAPDVYPMPGTSALLQFGIASAGFTLFGFFLYHTMPSRPSVPREYPYEGLKEALGGLEENKALVLSEDDDE